LPRAKSFGIEAGATKILLDEVSLPVSFPANSDPAVDRGKWLKDSTNKQIQLEKCYQSVHGLRQQLLFQNCIHPTGQIIINEKNGERGATPLSHISAQSTKAKNF
jgi:hypothetical protein